MDPRDLAKNPLFWLVGGAGTLLAASWLLSPRSPAAAPGTPFTPPKAGLPAPPVQLVFNPGDLVFLLVERPGARDLALRLDPDLDLYVQRAFGIYEVNVSPLAVDFGARDAAIKTVGIVRPNSRPIPAVGPIVAPSEAGGAAISVLHVQPS